MTDDPIAPSGVFAMPHVWIESMPRDSPAPHDVVERLRGQGLSVVPRDRGVAPGVIVFEACGPEIEDALRSVGAHPSASPVLAVATSPGTLTDDGAWKLIAAGAADVLVWDEAGETAHAIAARVARWAEVEQMLAVPANRGHLVGSSPEFLRVLRQIAEVAAFTSASILLLGESGTGKEQVARLVHAVDRRPDKGDLAILDCTTVVPELSGSEFFGHERGAFTGAVVPRDGAFALAHRGTLFLDEVGELPPSLQAQLLRVVQERTYKRVGGNHWLHTDFRLVSATNRDLVHEMDTRGFRRDFFHRIATWVFRLPPLRERREDIPVLAEHFVRQIAPSSRAPAIDDRVCQYLVRREYPGNVRELRQLVSRLCTRHVGTGPITVGDIPREELPSPTDRSEGTLDRAVVQAVLGGTGLKEILRASRGAAIRAALDVAGRNVQQAAKLLKVTDRALQMELAKRDD